MKLFNNTSVFFGFAAGILARIFGEWDMLIQTILILCITDYISGLIKAAYNKELSSEIGWKGILKKVAMFTVIALANVLQTVIGDMIPLREVVIMFFIANEGLSILENCAELVPIPDGLKSMLLQIRDRSNEFDTDEEDEKSA